MGADSLLNTSQPPAPHPVHLRLDPVVDVALSKDEIPAHLAAGYLPPGGELGHLPDIKVQIRGHLLRVHLFVRHGFSLMSLDFRAELS